MEKTIIRIHFDWFYTPNGEEVNTKEIGKTYGFKDGHGTIQRVVSSIEEHRAAGEGDKWYYDIHYTDGFMQRTFNPNQVDFQP